KAFNARCFGATTLRFDVQDMLRDAPVLACLVEYQLKKAAPVATKNTTTTSSTSGRVSSAASSKSTADTAIKEGATTPKSPAAKSVSGNKQASPSKTQAQAAEASASSTSGTEDTATEDMTGTGGDEEDSRTTSRNRDEPPRGSASPT
ncbi:unnamed protein product, partial [Amoebophrya sp. A25]